MYTWGYIKDAALAKLDLDEHEANVQNLLGRFYIYANEAMTQICSSIKPNRTFAKFVVASSALDRETYVSMHPDEIVYAVGEAIKMPEDFISFGDDVCTRDYEDGYGIPHIGTECHDEDFMYAGYNKVIFKKDGTYRISYNARWHTFVPEELEETVLDVPLDILDCLPSYIAHQCYKIDDETKSAIYRNEYEMFLARIDDTDFKQTKTYTIGGDW